ncbi:MAG: hypothetical protein ACUVQG_04230 [Thermogutta sp.]
MGRIKVRSVAVRFGVLAGLVLGLSYITGLIGGAAVKSEIAFAGDGVPLVVFENGEQQEERSGQDEAAKEAKGKEAAEEVKSEKQEAAETKVEGEKAEEAAKPVAKEEKPKEPEKRPVPAPTTVLQPPKHKVGRQLIKIEKSYAVTFQPRGIGEVRLDTKTWSTFRVVEAVEHGKEVRQGDVLVRFDREEFDRALVDQERAVRSAEMALEDAQKLLALMEQTVPFDLAAAERNLQITKEDTERYFAKGRDFDIRTYELNLRAAKMGLESAEEELRQLEKMYKADDLVEETEEFILKRQQFAVERARFLLAIEQDRYEEFHQRILARRDESVRRDLEMTEYQTQRSRINLPSLLAQQRMSVEQMKIDLERAKDRLSKLRADAAFMEIKAPCDGIVYYGEFARGEWGGATSLSSKLRPGGLLTKGDVIMTVVQMPPQTVRFTIGEVDLRWITVGLEGSVKPKSFPQVSLPACVTNVKSIPVAADRFDVVAEVTLPKKPLPLVPAMTGTIRFNVYVKEDAMVVPAKAVFAEELNPDERYVYVVKGDKYEKRRVTVGEQVREDLEILAGLRDGEEILLEKPKSDT